MERFYEKNQSLYVINVQQKSVCIVLYQLTNYKKQVVWYSGPVYSAVDLICNEKNLNIAGYQRLRVSAQSLIECVDIPVEIDG